MVLAAVSWGPQDHPQIETVDRLTELRKATVLRVTIYYSASQQRERREGKRVCSSFWLSSLCRRSWCLWHDIFALLTLESLPLLELASPEPAFPARPLPVPSHWWLLPTFPPHPQCLLTHPGAPTCGSSWHGLPPPPVLQNTLLGDSHSTMLGGSDVWPYVWSMTANQEAHLSLGYWHPMIHRTTPHNKELYSPQNVSIAEVEEPELGIIGVFLCLFWRPPEACEISVPQPGTEPGPQQWKPQILTTGPPGNSQIASMSKSLETVPL